MKTNKVFSIITQIIIYLKSINMKTNRVIRFIKNSINKLKTSIMNRNDQRLEKVEAKSTNFINKIINFMMNTKNKIVGNLEARSTTKNFRRIGPALMVVFMVIAFSAFTQISKKAVSEVCFTFEETINNPTDIQATDSENYSYEVAMNCLPDYETLCGVCFDESYFPLDVDGKPDFENNLDLKSIVEGNKDLIGAASRTIQVPGTTDQWVTLHFRAEK